MQSEFNCAPFTTITMAQKCEKYDTNPIWCETVTVLHVFHWMICQRQILWVTEQTYSHILHSMAFYGGFVNRAIINSLGYRRAVYLSCLLKSWKSCSRCTQFWDTENIRKLWFYYSMSSTLKILISQLSAIVFMINLGECFQIENSHSVSFVIKWFLQIYHHCQ